MIQTRIVGRLPLFFGEYEPGRTYQTMNRVSYWGSEFQVGFGEDYSYTTTEVPPFNGEPVKIILPDGTSKWTFTVNYPWIIVSDLTDAYMVSKDIDEIESSITVIDSSIQHIIPAVDFVYDTFEYIDNPEFVDVHVDSSSKVLYGAKSDGDFYFGGGVPSQVKNYVEPIKSSIVDTIDKMDASIREMIDDIDSSMNISVNRIDSSIQYMMPAVDLVYDTFVYIESPEFVDVHLDSSAKVLYGVRKDGDFVFGGGVPGQVKDFVGSVVPGINPDFKGIVYYGSDPDATMNPSKYVNMSIAGIYTVNTTENSHIYFFVPSNMSYFYATMGGMKIPFVESQITIDGAPYRMYESVNTYDEGVLDIMLA